MQVCALKNHATQTLQFCADQAVQILGGGAEDIMKDLAARQWRL